MCSNKRELSFSLAINDALHNAMALDEKVFVIGQGVKSPWYVGNTTRGLIDRFGEKRVIDTPVSENAITGAAVGAALAGMRPVVVHPRMDFMFYAFDPIINEAANWYYMFGGTLSVPVVFWGIINRGGEQAAQHSQALQAMLAHVPGLKVVMPSTPYDAKGLMLAAIQDDNPVVFIDDRWLYGCKEAVPEDPYIVPIGKGVVKREGKDVTLVSWSYMMEEAKKAAEELALQSIDVELIDLRSLKPFDQELILRSVKKTGRLVVVDGAWKTCGFAAEIAACVGESPLALELKAPICRVCLPDVPAPASRVLEEEYYIKAKDIVHKVKEMMSNILI